MFHQTAFFSQVSTKRKIKPKQHKSELASWSETEQKYAFMPKSQNTLTKTRTKKGGHGHPIRDIYRTFSKTNRNALATCRQQSLLEKLSQQHLYFAHLQKCTLCTPKTHHPIPCILCLISFNHVPLNTLQSMAAMK